MKSAGVMEGATEGIEPNNSTATNNNGSEQGTTTSG
jgi:hypothetical protein